MVVTSLWEWSRYNWSILWGHQWQTFFQVFKQTYDDMLAPLVFCQNANEHTAH